MLDLLLWLFRALRVSWLSPCHCTRTQCRLQKRTMASPRRTAFRWRPDRCPAGSGRNSRAVVLPGRSLTSIERPSRIAANGTPQRACNGWSAFSNGHLMDTSLEVFGTGNKITYDTGDRRRRDTDYCSARVWLTPWRVFATV